MNNDNNLTLLCVEDDEEALEDTAYLLKRYFKDVYTAIDGEDALIKYNKYKPDMILLDINMPKLNGLEVAEIIREKDEETFIIFLSAHSEKEKLLKAIELQVSSYIIKPFEIEALKSTVKKVIDHILLIKTKIDLNNNFEWDTKSNELYYNEKQIPITKNEILLINLLLEDRSRYLTVSELSVEICEKDKDANENNVVQLISRFKKKLKKLLNSDIFFMENSYGRGYRIQ